MNYNVMGKLLEFSITTCGYERLCTQWAHKLILNGSYYRLYWQSCAGAGVIINNRRHNLLPGYFDLLPPNCNLPTFCDNTKVHQLFVHFVLVQYACAPMLTAVPATEQLQEYAEKMRDTYLEPNAADTDVRRHLYAFALCAGVLAAMPKEIFSVRPRLLGVERVCTIIAENPGMDVNIATLSNLAGLSPSEFNRRFKEATGQTPYSYLNTLRYEIAADMLACSTSSIEEICDAVGIKDRFHFSRCFKKRYGHPPAAYRKMMQAQEPPETQ